MIDIAEEVLQLVNRSGKIAPEDILRNLSLSSKTTYEIIGFLVKFGLIEFDYNKQYLCLTSPMKRFVVELAKENPIVSTFQLSV